VQSVWDFNDRIQQAAAAEQARAADRLNRGDFGSQKEENSYTIYQRRTLPAGG
jgi:hypothetical protein